MYCPRCGAENQEGDRYCSSCGAELPEPGAGPPERRSIGERIRRLSGRTRRERLLAAGTAIAIVIAIAAFGVLDSGEDDDGVPRDAYTVALDRDCVEGKRMIAAAGRRLVDPDRGGDVGAYARDLLRAASEWRSTTGALEAPLDRRAEAGELDSALREVAVESAALARAARQGGDESVADATARVDEASVRVEEAIRGLDLERCARLRFVLGAGTEGPDG